MYVVVWSVFGWLCMMNSGETRRSRPSDHASPRRDLQKQAQTRTRALAQAKSFRLSETPSRPSERGLPKRGRVGVWGMCCRRSSGNEALFRRGICSPRRV